MRIPDWVQDAIFYQIFPDRFAKSKRHPAGRLPFESWDSPPTHHGFKGGDLYGVAEKLDYLSDLGITAIYLNPVFASACNHRYHTFDYYKVDPLLGGDDALRLLLAEARQRGLGSTDCGRFPTDPGAGSKIRGNEVFARTTPHRTLRHDTHVG